MTVLIFMILIAIFSFILGSSPLASLYIAATFGLIMLPIFAAIHFTKPRKLFAFILIGLWMVFVLFIPAESVGTFNYPAGGKKLYDNGYPDLIFALQVVSSAAVAGSASLLSSQWFSDRFFRQVFQKVNRLQD